MYKKSKSPWIRWDPSVFLSNTRNMNFQEIGIYTFLGQHFFIEQCLGIAHEDMVYLIRSNGSNETRLNKFKEKYPHFFKHGFFFCESLHAAFELAKERKSDSKKANDAKKAKREALESANINDNDDRAVTDKEKDKEQDTEINKQINREQDKQMIGSHIAKLTNKAINNSKGLNNTK